MSQVKPFSWPTTEPEIPPRASVSVPGSAVPDSSSSVHAEPAPQESKQVAALVEESMPAEIPPHSTHAFLWNHVTEAAAVLRTMMHQDVTGTDDEVLRGMSTTQLAAAVVAGMRRLHGEAETRWVARAVAEEPEVTHRVALSAL
jgi:hypothetical protein